ATLDTATSPQSDPAVWIPIRPARSGDRRISAELYGTCPGEKLLLIYDSPEEAWAARGPYQPGRAIHLSEVENVARECGAERIVPNGVVNTETQHTGPVRDWAREDRDSLFGLG